MGSCNLLQNVPVYGGYGRREDELGEYRLCDGFMNSRESICFPVLGPGAIGDGELETGEQSPPSLAWVEALSLTEVSKIVMIGKD